MPKIFFSVIVLLAAVACSSDKTAATHADGQEHDSLSFRVAVVPTVDCLPLYVGQHHGLFEEKGVPLHVIRFKSQMDCDTALMGASADAAVTDIVRAEHLRSRGVAIDCWQTGWGRWTLIGNSRSGIDSLSKMTDKMLAMTRFSATHLLADTIVGLSGLDKLKVFQIQINDIGIRQDMLKNNEMDAIMMQEPYATQLLMQGYHLLSRCDVTDIRLGALAMRRFAASDSVKQVEGKAFIEAYNMACDSIDKYGMGRYGKLLARHTGVAEEVTDSMPALGKIGHAEELNIQDRAKIGAWIRTQK